VSTGIWSEIFGISQVGNGQQIDGLETGHNGHSETGKASERDSQRPEVSIYSVMDGFDDFYMTPSAYWVFYLEIVCSKAE
jgi:hypothetical protein